MAWEDPKAAPAPLDLVQAFVNTANRMDGTDEFRTAPQAYTALSSLGVVGIEQQLSEAERQRLVVFREALRALLLARTERRGLTAAALELNRASGTVAVHARFSTEGNLKLATAPAVSTPDLVISTVVAVIAAGADDWGRLKACLNNDCHWAFFDASRNRSGRWCDMNVCGVRHNMRTYRQRRS